ncbi:MAG: PIG-L family deacetylase [Caulobacteraceae bacterium]
MSEFREVMGNKLQSLNKMIERPRKTVYCFPDSCIQKVIVLAPHPDDETLGCGGVIYSLQQKGADVAVILATDGNSGSRIEDIKRVRAEEFQAAVSVLGVSNTYKLGYPDGSLCKYEDSAAKDISKIFDREKPDLVFTPYIFDFNPDHVSTSSILKKCISMDNRLLIAMYEVWTPILHPDCYYNISDVFNMKLLAIKCYESQERYYGIREKAIALNSFRARMSMRRNVMYMEAFRLFHPQDYIEAVEVLSEIASMSEEL